MWKIAKINKLKSIFVFFVMLFWYIFCYGFFWGFFLIPLTMIIFINRTFDSILSVILCCYTVGLIAALLAFYIKLSMVKDKPYIISGCKTYQINKSEYAWLYDIVQDIAEFYELKQIPKLYFVDSDILNIYSWGISPKSASIIISKGLLDLLSKDELKSVIAHEISHIVNMDITYLFCSGVLYSFSQNFDNELDFENIRENKTLDFPPARGLAVILSGINKVINSLGIVFFKFISKNNEHIADTYACLYTKNPKSLANALTKIEENILKGKNYVVEDVIGASFIVPLMNDIAKYHPSTQKRIEMLLNS